MIGYVILFLICRNKELDLYYNPFGIFYIIIYTPMGIFVTGFCCNHISTITRGYTTKQLFSVKEFQKEMRTKDLDEKTLIVLDQVVKKDNEKDEEDLEIINDNKKNQYYEAITCGERWSNLCKFYCKKTPKSLVGKETHREHKTTSALFSLLLSKGINESLCIQRHDHIFLQYFYGISIVYEGCARA